MNHIEVEEIDELMCRARAIVNITMELLSHNRESDDDTEYALWAASELLSKAIELLNEPTPEWPVLGEDELAVQDGSGVVHFDQIFPEEVPDEQEGPELRVTPDGTVVTTTPTTHKELF